MTSRKADWSKRTAKKTAGTTVELDDAVAVPATPDTAWARLEDVPLVASCLPGLDPATLVTIEPNTFRATMTNSVMGISAKWDLRATISPDPERRTLRVVLDGIDPRLNMRLEGGANVAVRPHEAGQALLEYTASLRIDGSLAAMGGPVIRSILTDAIAQFVAVVGGQEQVEQRSVLMRLRERFQGWWRRVMKRSPASSASKGTS